MMTKFNWIITVLTLFLSINTIAGKTDINYTHKSLIKELEKNWDSDIKALVEVNVDSELPYQGKFFQLGNESGKFVYVGRVNSCRAGGCSLEGNHDGQSEYFDYFILFDKDARVELVKIYNYAATHGHEVMAKGWLKQFRGHNEENELKVGKNVDTISGATISVHAITDDITEKTNSLLKHIELQKLQAQEN